MSETASNGRRRRVGLISLGCAKNRVDSEIMLGELVAAGYELTPDLDAAETVIVNTCAFIDEAKQESIDTILEVAAQEGGRLARELLVAGCMVQQYGEELRAEIPEIDGFMSLDELRRVDTLVGLGGAPAPPRARRTWSSTTPPRACSRRRATPTSRSPRAATTRAPSARSRSGAAASAAAPSRAWWRRRSSSKPPAFRSSA